MRPVIVRRIDRAHRGNIIVMGRQSFEVPQGRPVRLSASVIRELRAARYYEYSRVREGWIRTSRRIYSVRQVPA